MGVKGWEGEGEVKGGRGIESERRGGTKERRKKTTGRMGQLWSTIFKTNLFSES